MHVPCPAPFIPFCHLAWRKWRKSLRWTASPSTLETRCLPRTCPWPAPMGLVVLDVWMLSFSESAKYGLMGRWPANHQVRAHFPSFLMKGYESHRESLDIKFDMSTVETDKSVYTIKPFTVGYVDGQNKAIIMLGILGLLIDMDPWKLFQTFTAVHILTPLKYEEDQTSLDWYSNGFPKSATEGISEEALAEDEGMAKAIASFRYIKCNFTRACQAWGVSYMRLFARAFVTLWDSLFLFCFFSRSLEPRPGQPHCREDEAVCLGHDAAFQGVSEDQAIFPTGSQECPSWCALWVHSWLQQDCWKPSGALSLTYLKEQLSSVFLNHHVMSSKPQLTKGWRVTDAMRKLIYNLLRCPLWSVGSFEDLLQWIKAWTCRLQVLSQCCFHQHFFVVQILARRMSYWGTPVKF